MFPEALFAIAPNWKLSKCPQKVEWGNELQCMCLHGGRCICDNEQLHADDRHQHNMEEKKRDTAGECNLLEVRKFSGAGGRRQEAGSW